EVIGFEKGADRRICKVLTANGPVEARNVVNAAGVWSALVGDVAGSPVNVIPQLRHVAVCSPAGLLSADMPMTIFVRDGFHARVRGERILLLRPEAPDGHDPFDVDLPGSWVAQILDRAAECFPCLRNAHLERSECYSG